MDWWSGSGAMLCEGWVDTGGVAQWMHSTAQREGATGGNGVAWRDVGCLWVLV